MAIEFSVQDHVATVVLNRPEAMNAIDPETRSELFASWQRIEDDPAVRVAVITGAGDRAFCTGADLKKTMPPKESFAELTFGKPKWLYPFAGMEIDKPAICAVNGYALAGGMELALACDIRIASTSAKFGQSEVCIGSIPAAGGTQRLPRTVGLSDAMLMMLTGDRIDAEQALRIGLVDEVVPQTRLEQRTFELAAKIASKSALAVRLAKAAVRASARLPLDQGLRFEQSLFALAMASEDKEEGVRAFLEKRDAAWKDR